MGTLGCSGGVYQNFQVIWGWYVFQTAPVQSLNRDQVEGGVAVPSEGYGCSGAAGPPIPDTWSCSNPVCPFSLVLLSRP